MEWLIDDLGTAWPDRSHPIASGTTPENAINYALSGLGFIHIRETTRGLTVRLTPRRVEQRTIISLFYFLLQSDTRRVVLSYNTDVPICEIAGSVGRAIRRLEELVGIHPSGERTIVNERRRSLDRPLKDFERPVSELLRTWAEIGGHWGLDRYEIFQTNALFRAAMLVHKPRASDRIIIDHWGLDRDMFGQQWTDIARGLDLEAQPIRNPDRAAALYRAMFVEGQPLLHDVDMLVPADNGPARRLRFQRLILPWKGEDGENTALSVAFRK